MTIVSEMTLLFEQIAVHSSIRYSTNSNNGRGVSYRGTPDFILLYSTLDLIVQSITSINRKPDMLHPYLTPDTTSVVPGVSIYA